MFDGHLMARPPFCFLCFSPFSLLLFSKSERWGRTTRNIQMRASTGNSDTNPQSTTKELWLQKKQSLHKEESVIEGVVMTNQGGLHTLITVGRQTTLMRNFFQEWLKRGKTTVSYEKGTAVRVTTYLCFTEAKQRVDTYRNG